MVSSKTEKKIMAFQLKFDCISATKQNLLEILRHYILLRNVQSEQKWQMSCPLAALKPSLMLVF